MVRPEFYIPHLNLGAALIPDEIRNSVTLFGIFSYGTALYVSKSSVFWKLVSDTSVCMDGQTDHSAPLGFLT